MDLLEDLCAGDQLDVEITCLDRMQYLGGSEKDVKLWHPKSEFNQTSGEYENTC